MNPHTVIFSSSSSLHIAQGLHQNLKEQHTIHLWKGDFFGENKTTPLWTFFKKLFNYDYAVLILSDDNIILDQQNEAQEIWVPRDNVIFELGATMARLGPQKTILLVPDYLQIKLPGYFDNDVIPVKFYYSKPITKDLEDSIAATQIAALGISTLLSNTDPETFHSELPAQGLAHAYVHNFLAPALYMEQPQQFTMNNEAYNWEKQNGIIITVITPTEIMGRRQANDFFNTLQNCYNINIQTTGGRNLSVYALQRKSENSPLHILDIPTTLFTAGEIVESIETFWREKDHHKVIEKDTDFSESLKKREIVNFSRSLEKMYQDKDIKIHFIPIDQIQQHILDNQ